MGLAGHSKKFEVYLKNNEKILKGVKQGDELDSYVAGMH